MCARLRRAHTRPRAHTPAHAQPTLPTLAKVVTVVNYPHGKKHQSRIPLQNMVKTLIFAKVLQLVCR